MWETVGTAHGFVGCINKLRVGRRPIEFVETRDPLISQFHQVSQCPVLSASYNSPLGFTTPMYSAYDENRRDQNVMGSPQEPQDRSSANHNSHFNSNNNPFSSVGLNAYAHVEPKTNACSKNKCKNYGQCWKDWGQTKGYRCVCHPEYTGWKFLFSYEKFV